MPCSDNQEVTKRFRLLPIMTGRSKPVRRQHIAGFARGAFESLFVYGACRLSTDVGAACKLEFSSSECTREESDSTVGSATQHQMPAGQAEVCIHSDEGLGTKKIKSNGAMGANSSESHV